MGFGTTSVTIATATNPDIGALELENDIHVKRGLLVYARPGTSSALAAVRNTGGENTIEGNVTFSTGGSYYNFESAAGKLTLLGNLAGNASTSGSGRTIMLYGAGDGVIQGNISNGPAATASFQVHKNGTSTWDLRGVHSYTNITKVMQGRLNVVGTHTGGATYSISSGAMLSGSGTLELANHESFLFANGSQLSVGDLTPGMGFMSLTTIGTGSVSFGNNSQILMDIWQGGGHRSQNVSGLADFLQVIGKLDTGSNVQVVISAESTSTWQAGDTWQLFDWSQVSGGMNANQLEVVNDVALEALGAVWDLSEFYTAGEVRLISIPEPSRMLLGLVGFITFGLRRRR